MTTKKDETKKSGINWIVRKNNVVFVFNVVMAVLVPVLAYFGLTVEDLTTWDKVGSVIVEACMNPFVLGMAAVGLFNAVVDPTTKGISDSKLALSKTKPSDKVEK